MTTNTLEENLKFAKDIVKLRDAFLDGTMENCGYIKKRVFDSSTEFIYTLYINEPAIFSFSKTIIPCVSSFKGDSKYRYIMQETTPSGFWIEETDTELSRDEITDISCSEEFQFQNSLLYSTSTCKELIAFAYCKENPISSEYNYFVMNVTYIPSLLIILDNLKNRIIED